MAWHQCLAPPLAQPPSSPNGSGCPACTSQTALLHYAGYCHRYCTVTNVTYNENKHYVVTLIVYLESSLYLHRRQWLRQIVVLGQDQWWSQQF